MKIIFLLLNLSDLDKPSGMYSDLITEFIENGHEVFPVAVSQRKGKTYISLENGVKVLRVNSLPLFNVNSVRKGIANLLLPLNYKKAIKKFLKDIRPELIVVPTPPVTFSALAVWLKRRHDAKVYLILRDIFPQNAVDLGLLKKGGLFYNYFRNQEKNLYNCSDSIGCMSPGNIEYLVKHNPGIDPNKLHILMNFQKTVNLNEKIFGVRFREQNGFLNKFIVVFGGNMGLPQKIENVIALAKECLTHNDVCFLFIGDGTQRTRIQNLAVKENVTNIVFRDYIPRDEYLQVVRECDIGLISLNESYTIPNIPSKTMSYFDAEIPVLASIDKATDYGKILLEAGAGLVSEAGDLKAFYNNFCTLYSSPDLRKQMGRNGKKYLKEHMSVQEAYKIIIENV